MKQTFGLLLLIPILSFVSPAALAEVERFSLYQRQEVMAQQQRIVGNLRAVARREGVVVNVPQLYVYHADFSEGYHLPGVRSGFEHELERIVERRRGARSMVRLDRLLERVKTVDGESFSLDDLPPADIYIVLYRRDDCPECDQVASMLERWIDDHPEREVVWLDVRTDPPRERPERKKR